MHGMETAYRRRPSFFSSSLSFPQSFIWSLVLSSSHSLSGYTGLAASCTTCQSVLSIKASVAVTQLFLLSNDPQSASTPVRYYYYWYQTLLCSPANEPLHERIFYTVYGSDSVSVTTFSLQPSCLYGDALHDLRDSTSVAGQLNRHHGSQCHLSRTGDTA